MRKLGFLVILAGFIVSFAHISHADPKPWVWGWWPSHWQGLDFKPYLGDQQIKNRSLWDNDNWTPQAWIKDAGGDAKRIMRDLYASGVITDQYENGDDVPVLEVGESFMRLSNTDRIRVLRFVDHVFEITKEPNGMFFIYYKEADNAPVGTYDKRGFQQY